MTAYDRYDDYLIWDAQQDWLDDYFNDLADINAQLEQVGMIAGWVVA